MPNLGPTELIIILLIVIAVFGAGKLANLGGALGKGVKDFKQAVTDSDSEPEAEDQSPTQEAAAEEPTAE